MLSVPIPSTDPAQFAKILDEAGYQGVIDLEHRARQVLGDRIIWNINSTATGGGVAEMLLSLLSYAVGAGVAARWLVMEGDTDFFRVTKRIHNALHGAAGDGGPLGPAERRVYEQTIARNVAPVLEQVRPGDLVLVHDPQPAGLVGQLKAHGAHVVWRLHVGADEPNARAHEAWEFLRPYVAPADGWVFSREAFIWDGLDRRRSFVIAPSIDVFAPKNEDIDDAEVRAILAAAGLLDGDGHGIQNKVRRRATVIEERPLQPDAPLVLQVSRWDVLKDHPGVLRAFVDRVAPDHPDAELVLAGPSVEGVTDDPEGTEELARVGDLWRTLPSEVRARVHIASLPMEDRDENAWMVNALQRHATVVVQKSLAEGFGLTVSEGMWKNRPVVASAVGGIQEQIIDGENGFLVGAHDLTAFSERISRLLDDRALAERLGAAGRARVLDRFIEVRHLREWVDLVERLPR